MSLLNKRHTHKKPFLRSEAFFFCICHYLVYLKSTLDVVILLCWKLISACFHFGRGDVIEQSIKHWSLACCGRLDHHMLYKEIYQLLCIPDDLSFTTYSTGCKWFYHPTKTIGFWLPMTGLCKDSSSLCCTSSQTYECTDALELTSTSIVVHPCHGWCGSPPLHNTHGSSHYTFKQKEHHAPYHLTQTPGGPLLWLHQLCARWRWDTQFLCPVQTGFL